MNVLVIAPHPDDELLGCGGTLLFLKEKGYALHWLIITSAKTEDGYSDEIVAIKQNEINKISDRVGFVSTIKLNYSTAKLDIVPLKDILDNISHELHSIRPSILFVPFRGDVHSDHEIVFDCVISCSKSFRCSFIKKILAYETISETDFNLRPDSLSFRPNVFFNIESFIDKKLELLDCYQSEIEYFPFPRSKEAIEALATLRGSQAGCKSAEAFMLLKEIIS